MTAALFVLLFASAPPTSLDCIGAFQKRNALAIRAAALLNREADRGHLNRAERGALNAALQRRNKLLACGPEADL